MESKNVMYVTETKSRYSRELVEETELKDFWEKYPNGKGKKDLLESAAYVSSTQLKKLRKEIKELQKTDYTKSQLVDLIERYDERDNRNIGGFIVKLESNEDSNPRIRRSSQVISIY